MKNAVCVSDSTVCSGRRVCLQVKVESLINSVMEVVAPGVGAEGVHVRGAGEGDDLVQLDHKGQARVRAREDKEVRGARHDGTNTEFPGGSNGECKSVDRVIVIGYSFRENVCT